MSFKCDWSHYWAILSHCRNYHQDLNLMSNKGESLKCSSLLLKLINYSINQHNYLQNELLLNEDLTIHLVDFDLRTLSYLMDFLIEGQIHFDSENQLSEFMELLQLLFGIQRNQLEITFNNIKLEAEAARIDNKPKICSFPGPCNDLNANLSSTVIPPDSLENPDEDDDNNDPDLENLSEDDLRMYNLDSDHNQSKLNVKEEDENSKSFNKKSYCYICEDNFSSLNSLKEHCKDRHMEDEMFYCQKCGEKFSKFGGLQRHLNKKCNSQNLSRKPVESYCYICEREIPSIKALKAHFQLLHPDDKMYKCKKCDKKFSRLETLQEHDLKTHVDIKDLPKAECKKCGLTFDNIHRLRDHRIAVHSQRYEKVRCHECGKLIGSNNMAEHMKTHTNQRDFVCDICGHRVINSQLLKVHKYRNHVKTKGFNCGICKVRFKTIKELTYHRKTHTQDEINYKFVCTICGEKFHNNRAYWEHRTKKHGPQVTFKCRICDKDFKSREGTSRHIIAHHTKFTPFSCLICKEVFKYKLNGERHLKSFHLNDNLEKQRIEYKPNSELQRILKESIIRLKDSH